MQTSKVGAGSHLIYRRQYLSWYRDLQPSRARIGPFLARVREFGTKGWTMIVHCSRALLAELKYALLVDKL